MKSRLSIALMALTLSLSAQTTTGQNRVIADSTQFLNEKNEALALVDFVAVYPLTPDRIYSRYGKIYKDCFIFPLIVINGIPVRDSTVINHFRNNLKKAGIQLTKLLSRKSALLRGIPNPPEDGVIFVICRFPPDLPDAGNIVTAGSFHWQRWRNWNNKEGLQYFFANVPYN